MSQPPVIDIAALTESPVALAALDDACRIWGFFYVTGHGVDDDLCQAVHAQMRTFFALPMAEKQRIVRTDANVWGFYDRELTKNTRDWKEIFDVGPAESRGPVAGARPQWPDALPEFRPTMLAFMDACRKAARRLIAGISLDLGMPAEHLEASFEPRDSSFLRLNYYPVCADPAAPDSPSVPESGHLGINRHTDAGALTLLLQDSRAGLQAFNNGAWHLIEPLPGALLVNIGDVVQVWSNDRYRAPLHRVIASSDAPRHSAPFFFNPDYATSYAPLPSVCDETNEPRYGPINWGEFRAARAAGDYADYGEEIQISDFRVGHAAETASSPKRRPSARPD